MIFFSHSSADTARLTALVDLLRERGVELWFDGERILLSDSVPRAMSGGIERSDRLLVAWSAAAAGSEHVWNEIDAFYMLHPAPGSMLFLRIDDTSVPALYAARIFLQSRDAPADANAIANWLEGRAVGSQNGTKPTSPAQAIQQFPRGPMVPAHWIPESIVTAYAMVANTPVKGRAMIDRAIRLRKLADANDPNVKHVRHGELLIMGDVGADAYWFQAFTVCGLYGPRMVAALLLVQDDDLFDQSTRRDRAELILKLRLMGQTTGGEA